MNLLDLECVQILPYSRQLCYELNSQPEWYIRRISLALAYLQAESQLLKPYPQLPSDQIYAPGQPNPHLPSAHQALTRNLRRYHSTRGAVDGMEKGAGSFGGYLDFAARSVAGLFRSRHL
jgi:hypothetical protein